MIHQKLSKAAQRILSGPHGIIGDIDWDNNSAGCLQQFDILYLKQGHQPPGFIRKGFRQVDDPLTVELGSKRKSCRSGMRRVLATCIREHELAFFNQFLVFDHQAFRVDDPGCLSGQKAFDHEHVPVRTSG